MIGRKINQYEILSKLGEGGMGVVYKAHDEKLHRHVAMKFLPREMSADPGVQKRFIQEARASSALDHPNISTVYEINETEEGGLFIVMPCYEGETLRERLERGPLEVNEALRIAAEVARGLARAHDSGVIHRDIKPGNIMLVKDGPAKIMDFGLAMISGASRLTQDGTTLGTAAYMSPEQAQGSKIDSRTDVWALGAVLYEMLSGSAPFEADHHLAVMYSIMNEEPEPLSRVDTGIPFEVEQLISKAMEKDADRRFQTAREMTDSLEELREQLDLLPKRTELAKRMIRQRRQLVMRGVFPVIAVALIAVVAWYLWSGRAEAKYPIVVLPFETISGSSDEELLSTDITENLTSNLSHIGSIGVISNRTAGQFRDSDKSTSVLADELRVKAVLYGSVEESGARLTLSVELVQVVPERILWKEEVECSIGELLDVYQQMTLTIAEKIGVKITREEEERLAESREVADEVYQEYLLGKHFVGLQLENNTPKFFAAGRSHFNRAISLDSTYAPPRAGLAWAIAYYYRWRINDERDSLLAVARWQADKALELDPECPDVYIARKELLFQELDFEGMKREYEKVLELDQSTETLVGYSGNFLTWLGEFEKAVAIAREAVEQEPIALYTHHNLSWVLYIARRYGEALDEIRKTNVLFPGPAGDFLETWALIALKRYEEAAQSKRDRGEEPGYTDEESWRAYMLGVIEKDSLMCEKGGWNFRAYEISRSYASLEYNDQAMHWLEEASRVVPVDLTQINSDPQFDVLRPDPRFQALMKKMGIPSGELAALENP